MLLLALALACGDKSGDDTARDGEADTAVDTDTNADTDGNTDAGNCGTIPSTGQVTARFDGEAVDMTVDSAPLEPFQFVTSSGVPVLNIAAYGSAFSPVRFECTDVVYMNYTHTDTVTYAMHQGGTCWIEVTEVTSTDVAGCFSGSDDGGHTLEGEFRSAL